jgi:hypothetical protein
VCKALCRGSNFIEFELVQSLLLILHLVLGGVSLTWLSLRKLAHLRLSLGFLSLLLLVMRHVLGKVLGLLTKELCKHIHHFGLDNLISCRLHIDLLLLSPLIIIWNFPLLVRRSLRILMLLDLLW